MMSQNPRAKRSITCPFCKGVFFRYESATHLAELLGKLGGKVKSEAKAAAARENGKKGGRPRKKK